MEKGLYFTPISTFLGSVGQGTRSVTQFPFLSNCDDNIYFTVLFGRLRTLGTIKCYINARYSKGQSTVER